MGFFSWVKSDDGESISSIDSSRGAKTVFLVQPHGGNIKESSYAGFGIFGGVDAYLWLAVMNLSVSENDHTPDDLRGFGIHLEFGFDVYQDCDGNIYTSKDLLKLGKIVFGKTCYDCSEFADVTELTKKSLPELTYPLKFSARENAVYSELKSAVRCQNQGFFYD